MINSTLPTDRTQLINDQPLEPTVPENILETPTPCADAELVWKKVEEAVKFDQSNYCDVCKPPRYNGERIIESITDQTKLDKYLPLFHQNARECVETYTVTNLYGEIYTGKENGKQYYFNLRPRSYTKDKSKVVQNSYIMHSIDEGQNLKKIKEVIKKEGGSSHEETIFAIREKDRLEIER